MASKSRSKPLRSTRANSQPSSPKRSPSPASEFKDDLDPRMHLKQELLMAEKVLRRTSEDLRDLQMQKVLAKKDRERVIRRRLVQRMQEGREHAERLAALCQLVQVSSSSRGSSPVLGERVRLGNVLTPRSETVSPRQPSMSPVQEANDLNPSPRSWQIPIPAQGTMNGAASSRGASVSQTPSYSQTPLATQQQIPITSFDTKASSRSPVPVPGRTVPGFQTRSVSPDSILRQDQPSSVQNCIPVQMQSLAAGSGYWPASNSALQMPVVAQPVQLNSGSGVANGYAQVAMTSGFPSGLLRR